jgi:hypothetical protein
MWYYVIKHNMNEMQHLKMIEETHGMQVRCFYAVYGTIVYQVNEVTSWCFSNICIFPPSFKIQICNGVYYHKEGEPAIFNALRG